MMFLYIYAIFSFKNQPILNTLTNFNIFEWTAVQGTNIIGFNEGAEVSPSVPPLPFLAAVAHALR